MSRFTPTTVLSEYAAITAINANFSDISVLLDEMLSRYGDSSNAMQSNLDMNHFKVLNLGNASDNSDAVNYGQVLALIASLQTSSSNQVTVVTPQMFGAKGDGVTNDGAAFVAAIAYLKSIAVNINGSIYKGSPKLFVPAGHYYMGTTTLDITHTFIMEGEGAGRHFGVGTRLRWADTATGIRTQRYDTSGVSTVDNVNTHFGGDGLTVLRIRLSGGYAGTESESHGIHAKTRINIGDDVWIDNWPGEGIHALAQIGAGSPNEGDASVSIVKHTRLEDNRIGFRLGLGDANVITTLACEFVNNRQAGYVENGGAGSNSLIGCHAVGNGLLGGSNIPTACTYSGRHYHVVWGQEAGASTNAPTGTEVDNTWWYHVDVGSASTAFPTWVSGTVFRSGGDYITGGGSNIINCYMEGGDFSQFAAFGAGALITGGSLFYSQYRGGCRLKGEVGDGLVVETSSSNAIINLDHNNPNAFESGLYGRYQNSAFAYMTMIRTVGNYYLGNGAGHTFRVGTTGSYVTPVVISTSGINLASGKNVTVNGLQVLGTQGAAVARLTRTATAGSLPTPDGSITIANAATPTVVELLEYCTELESKLETLTARFRAATGHGLIA